MLLLLEPPGQLHIEPAPPYTHIILQTSPLPKCLLASNSGQEASVLGACAHGPGRSILVSLDQNPARLLHGLLQTELLHSSINPDERSDWVCGPLQLLQPLLAASLINAPWWWAEQTSEQIKAQNTALVRTRLLWTSLWSTRRCSRGPADVLVCHVKSK